MTYGIVTFLIFAVLPLVYRLLRRSHSTCQIEEDKKYHIQELAAKFKRWDIYNLFFGWALIALSVFVWLRVLLFLEEWHFRAIITNSRFYSLPGLGVWFLLALFLGMPTGILFYFVVLRFLLGVEFGQYVRYYNLKYGFDAYNLLKPVLTFISTASFIISLLGINYYSAFTDSRIIIGRFGFGGKSYLYTDVSAVKLAYKFKTKSGYINENPRFLIIFNDARTWDSTNRSHYSFEVNKELAEFVAGKSSKTLLEVELETQ